MDGIERTAVRGPSSIIALPVPSPPLSSLTESLSWGGRGCLSLALTPAPGDPIARTRPDPLLVVSALASGTLFICLWHLGRRRAVHWAWLRLWLCFPCRGDALGEDALA